VERLRNCVYEIERNGTCFISTLEEVIKELEYLVDVPSRDIKPNTNKQPTEEYLKFVKSIPNDGGIFTQQMINAVMYGYLSFIEFIHNNRIAFCQSYTINCAIVNGHVDIVKFLFRGRQTEFLLNICHSKIYMLTYKDRPEIFEFFLYNYCVDVSIKWTYFEDINCNDLQYNV
jgi:hypothetical protein